MKLSNCRKTLHVATHRISFPSLKQSVLISCTITAFGVTSSLALDNWGQKYCRNQLFLKDFPSVFWKIARFLGKIKNTVSLRFISLSFPSQKKKGQYLWSGGVALVCSSLCYFFIPALLGIVFLCCIFFYCKSGIKYPARRAFLPAYLCTSRPRDWHSRRLACLLGLFTFARIACLLQLWIRASVLENSTWASPK